MLREHVDQLHADRVGQRFCVARQPILPLGGERRLRGAHCRRCAGPALALGHEDRFRGAHPMLAVISLRTTFTVSLYGVISPSLRGGFEPPTSPVRGERATRLRYTK